MLLIDESLLPKQVELTSMGKEWVGCYSPHIPHVIQNSWQSLCDQVITFRNAWITYRHVFIGNLLMGWTALLVPHDCC